MMSMTSPSRQPNKGNYCCPTASLFEDLHMANSFFWYDVMTTDTTAAQKFYADVVGWTMEDTGPVGHGYVLLKTHGQAVAGLMSIPDDAAQQGARPAWMGYI